MFDLQVMSVQNFNNLSGKDSAQIVLKFLLLHIKISVTLLPLLLQNMSIPQPIFDIRLY